MPSRTRTRSGLGVVIAMCALTAGGCFNLSDVEAPMDAPPARLTSQVEDWRDEVIYQVLVDRFVNGDPSNDWRVNRRSLARYQGGDWQGMIDNLDYFKSLGVTTLWISPIVRNVDTDAGIDGYHGYWASDLAELNPHFGNLATLRRLVREAHAKNLRVVVDIVTNHMGQMFYYDINQNGRPDDNLYGGGMNSGFQNPGGSSSPLTRVSEYDPDYNTRDVIQSYTSLGPAGPAPVYFMNLPEIFRTPPRCDGPRSWQCILASPDGYHRRGRIVSYDNVDHQPGEQVMLGDFPGGLKDVATERADVRTAMVEAYARWVELLDLDGFRIDTLKHVEHGFWSDFGPRIRARLAARGKQRFFLFGEAFDGDDELIGSYTRPGEMDSVFYFSQKFRMYRDVFQCEGPTTQLEGLLSDRMRNYNQSPQENGAGAPPSQLLVNFFDNHDVPRFLAGILDEDPNSCPAGRVRNEQDRERVLKKLHAALAFLFTQDGIPCLYYGTEQQFRGGNDPSNREVLWETASDYRVDANGTPNAMGGFTNDHARDLPTQGATFQWISRLSKIRRAYAPLRRGAISVKWTTNRPGTADDGGMLAFERADDSGAVLVVLNTSGDAREHRTAFEGNGMQVSFPSGTELVDVLDPSANRTFTVANGRVTVSLPAYSAAILVPRDRVVALP
jgi:alpha-amylase